MRFQGSSDTFPVFTFQAIMEAKNNVLVLYDSLSGNTAKMAELVAEGASAIPGIEVRVRNIDEATAEDVVWCDGLAVGSPTNMGLLSWKMKRFWDTCS